MTKRPVCYMRARLSAGNSALLAGSLASGGIKTQSGFHEPAETKKELAREGMDADLSFFARILWLLGTD
ncbi:MAG: hypothetical protein ACRD2L_05020, partial [Terriglobia bacterium]